MHRHDGANIGVWPGYPKTICASGYWNVTATAAVSRSPILSICPRLILGGCCAAHHSWQRGDKRLANSRHIKQVRKHPT
jgi:hypothetical protein